MRKMTIATVALLAALGACSRTDDGKVVVDRPGDVDVKVKTTQDTLSLPRVETGTRTDTVTVPDVDINKKKKTVTVPTVDVKRP